MGNRGAASIRWMLLLALVLVLGYPMALSAAGGEVVWEKRAAMPTARSELGAAASNGKIYAIGGRPPFKADTPTGMMHADINLAPPDPTQFHAGIPPVATAVVLRALAKDPAERYQSGRQFIQVLQRATAEATRSSVDSTLPA